MLPSTVVTRYRPAPSGSARNTPVTPNGDGTYAYTVYRDIPALKAQVDAMTVAAPNNKADLGDRLAFSRAQLAPFRALGYEVIEVSALHGAAGLLERLSSLHAIFVGQSGMGKSTLTNALIPEANAATREISAALDSGKHTTTFARLYALDGQMPDDARGWLIDSPGLQVFGLAHLGPDELAECFIEFRPLLGRCRFRDCRHEEEPGCALLEALADGRVHPRRFEHYRSIRAEIAEAKRLNPGW